MCRQGIVPIILHQLCYLIVTTKDSASGNECWKVCQPRGKYSYHSCHFANEKTMVCGGRWNTTPKHSAWLSLFVPRLIGCRSLYSPHLGLLLLWTLRILRCRSAFSSGPPGSVTSQAPATLTSKHTGIWSREHRSPGVGCLVSFFFHFPGTSYGHHLWFWDLLTPFSGRMWVEMGQDELGYCYLLKVGKGVFILLKMSGYTSFVQMQRKSREDR